MADDMRDNLENNYDPANDETNPELAAAEAALENAPPQELVDEFVLAAHHDEVKVADMLRQHPDLLLTTATWFETPLQAAAHTGNSDIAGILLDAGAPLDLPTAAMLGRAEDVRAFMREDANAWQVVGAHNLPAMYFAAIGGNVEIAQMLKDAGADLTAGEGKQTPLHGAATFGQAAMVRWLLQFDPDVYAIDFDGKTALERAEQNQHTDIVQILRDYGVEA